MRQESEASAEQRARLAAELIARLSGAKVPAGLPAAAPSSSAAAMYQHDLFASRSSTKSKPQVVEPPASAPARRERFVLFAVPLVKAILEGRKTVTRRLVVPPGKPCGRCPFGVPGDTLCVREKWGYRDEFFVRRHRAAGPIVYAADGPPAGAKILAWRPSMHMPRTACRILLTVTAARAERLTQISPQDAIAEGCPASYRHDPIGWFRQVWDRFHADRGGGWSADPLVWVISFTAAGA